jgi:membrane protein DedA with SNARE-associated domain
MMRKKLVVGILGGILGCFLGLLLGGYLGLVIGGTFLGYVKFFDDIPIEAYVMTAYIGGIIGSLVMTMVGVKFALKRVYKPKNNE